MSTTQEVAVAQAIGANTPFFSTTQNDFSALGTGRIFPAIHITFDWSLAVLVNIPFALFMFLLVTFAVAMTANTALVRPNI